MGLIQLFSHCTNMSLPKLKALLTLKPEFSYFDIKDKKYLALALTVVNVNMPDCLDSCAVFVSYVKMPKADAVECMMITV